MEFKVLDDACGLGFGETGSSQGVEAGTGAEGAGFSAGRRGVGRERREDGPRGKGSGGEAMVAGTGGEPGVCAHDCALELGGGTPE